MENIFQNNINHEAVKIINNIQFTNRELDVIACILGGRATKKIASLLDISIKTAENHIHNIMLKIGCNSRERVIDFVEKSEQFSAIKKYYSNLLIKVTFETKLKKIASFTASERPINLIIYYKEQKKDALISQLEKHLKLAGIQIHSEVLQNNQINITGDTQLTNYLIYNMSQVLKQGVETKELNTNYLYSLVTSIQCCTILLELKSEIKPHDISNTFPNIIYLSLEECENYYFLVFEILKKLLKHDLIQIINEFKKQYKIFLDYAYLQQHAVEEDFLEKKPISNIKTIQWHKKNVLSKKKFIIIPLTLLSCIGFILTVKNFVSLNSHPTSFIASQEFIAKNIPNNINNQTINKTTILNLPIRNMNFTDRKNGFIQIKKQLNKQKLGVITQVISGFGGVGKTQLATEFAYYSAENSEYSVILWIAAETSNTIYYSYKEIADNLQINIDGLNLSEIQTLVHKKLVDNYKNTKILIILDNVPNYDEISNYLNKTHKQLSTYLNPHILITSRSQHWNYTPLILDVFTSVEALAFIKKYLPYETEDNINKLVFSLHYFPLALGQAVAYIKNHTNIDDYLILYKSQQKDFLDKFPGEKNQYNESLWKTWNIAINKLSDTARELLFISAYLEPDKIPFDFFDYLSVQEKTNAIEDLRKYSFITLINNDCFKIHRLLQEVIKLSLKHHTMFRYNILKTEDHWINKAIELVNYKFDFDFLQPQKWKSWSNYLSQVHTIANNAINIRNNLQNGIKLYIKYAMFLTYINYDSKSAIEAWEKIIFLVKKHCSMNVARFIINNINVNICSAQYWLGKPQKAIDILNNIVFPEYKNLSKLVQTTEDELIDLTRIISFKKTEKYELIREYDLILPLLVNGKSQHALGFLSEALTSYNDALKIFSSENLGKYSQCYKIYTMWYLSRLYIYQGKFIEAENILKRINKPVNKLYKNHCIQANTYSMRALLMYQLGNFKKAIRLFNKCSKLRHSILSSSHIQHADTSLELAFNYHMLDKNKLAKQHFIQSKTICEEHEHYDRIMDLLINLGLWKVNENLGEYTEAAQNMLLAFKIAKAHYNKNSLIAIKYRLTQAEFWPKLKNPTKILYWQSILRMSKELFGKKHCQTARYHYMLGQALEYKHEKQKAHNHYEQALKILAIQKISHPNLEQFYIKNTQSIQDGLQRTMYDSP